MLVCCETKPSKSVVYENQKFIHSRLEINVFLGFPENPLLNVPLSNISFYYGVFQSFCANLVSKKNIHSWIPAHKGCYITISLHKQPAFITKAISIPRGRIIPKGMLSRGRPVVERFFLIRVITSTRPSEKFNLLVEHWLGWELCQFRTFNSWNFNLVWGFKLSLLPKLLVNGMKGFTLT